MGHNPHLLYLPGNQRINLDMISITENKARGTGEVYFREPLLFMTYGGRLTARIVMNAWVIIHVVATVTFILSDIPWLFWLGLLNALYLLDRLFWGSV